MSTMSAATPTSSAGGVLAGRVSGAMLALIRRQANLTQEAFAERTGVSVATVQGWESGRKPLVNMPYARLQRLGQRLHAADGDPAMLFLWRKALDADALLAGLDTLDPDEHPLAYMVPDRTTTELLTWPISGRPPRQLETANVTLTAGLGELQVVTSTLRDVLERAHGDGEQAAMLSRQGTFVLAHATEDHDATAWAADTTRRDLRRPGDLTVWTPRWPVARSAAIAAAQAGDPDPLRRFIREGLENDALIAANLRYWAYWVGEFEVPWDRDSVMTEVDGENWPGTRLLATLLAGIRNAPYRDLCAHTLWALLSDRRSLAFSSQWQPRIRSAVAEALESRVFSDPARQRLEQVAFLVGSM